MIRRLAVLATLVALAGCAAPRLALPPAAPTEAAAQPPAPNQCRLGPDGGIPAPDRRADHPTDRTADRGIGGTGAPASLVAERGIGGTGSPNTGQATGIVGVITGFASVCLAGQEVQYSPDIPVLIDGARRLADLRAGQVAAIEATGMQPMARSLLIRHEVSGPLERIEPDGALRVAGQRVIPPPGTPAPQPDTWFFVSGLRGEDGAIIATRLDPRGPGEVMVRGIMRNDRGRLYIGLLEIRPGRTSQRDQFRQPGIPVIAIGHWTEGVLEADTVEPDALLLDPGAFFGNRVGVLVIEGYAQGGFFRFGPGRYGAPFATGRTLLRLERGPGNTFAPAFIRPFGPASPFPARLFPARTAYEPAPLPNRALDRRPFAGPRFGGERPAFRGARERPNDQGFRPAR